LGFNGGIFNDSSCFWNLGFEYLKFDLVIIVTIQGFIKLSFAPSEYCIHYGSKSDFTQQNQIKLFSEFIRSSLFTMPKRENV